MKKNLQILKQHHVSLQKLLIVFLSFAFAFNAGAQVNLTNGSNTYSQSFNGLGTSSVAWTNNTTLAGWFAASTNLAANGLVVGTGSSTTGNLNNFGSAATPADRALGSLASGSTGTLNYGVQIKNTGTTNITSIQLTYTGEQWRDGGNNPAVSQKMTFDYATIFTSITSGTYTTLTALDFTSPKFTITPAALDGNAAANRTTGITSTITGLNIAPNSSIMLRWIDINDAGNDHGLALDDLSLTATFAAACSVTATVDQIAAPTCNAGTNGTARITLSGAGTTSTGTYSLDGATAVSYSSNPFTVSGLAAGGHTVVATTSTPCTSNTASFTVGAGAAAFTSTGCSKTDVTGCFGNTNGSVSMTTSGGSGTTTYTLSGSGSGTNNTGSFTGLGAGTYTITATNTCGTLTCGPQTITQPAQLSTIVTTASACDSYTWSVNGVTYAASGTYNATIGCQPYTLNLTITASTSNTTTASACDTYTWSVNVQTYTSSGTYTSVSGCHTEILNLTITTSTSNTTTASACDTYTWSVNGHPSTLVYVPLDV